MKCVISGLPELVGDNQVLLAHLILYTMDMNSFKVDSVSIEFQPDDGEPINPPDVYKTQGDN